METIYHNYVVIFWFGFSQFKHISKYTLYVRTVTVFFYCYSDDDDEWMMMMILAFVKFTRMT